MASTIGDERHERAAPVAAEGEQQHQRDREQARRAASPGAARGGDLGARLGRQHRQADELRVTPAGGCRLERICSISCCCSASAIRRIPNASVATRRSGVITSWEKYGGITLEQLADFSLGELRAACEPLAPRVARRSPLAGADGASR